MAFQVRERGIFQIGDWRSACLASLSPVSLAVSSVHHAFIETASQPSQLASSETLSAQGLLFKDAQADASAIKD